MAVKKHGVHFDVTAENATDRALRAVEHNLGRVDKAAASMGRALQASFIATAAITAGKAFAAAAIEAEQASKRLDAVLKATGHSAGLTKNQLDDMADAMAASTQFDDESLRNAQAQMLKFGNIHGETFRQALVLSTDLAAFMGTDLQSAVQAVGKAMTSPAEGLGALEKQVGKFNPAARQMIQNLVESGNEAKAQALVLDLLKGKIGGTAEALNTGLAKSVNNLKKAWDELNEASGKATGPAIALGLGRVTDEFKRLKEIIESGSWAEKALALLAMGSPVGRLTGLKPGLTPNAPDARNNVKGAIIGAPAAMSLDAELAGAPMSERAIKDWKEMLALQEKSREEAKKRKEAQIRDDEQVARRIVDQEEDTQRIITEAQEAWQKQRQEQDKQAAEDKAEMWKQVFDQIDREREEEIEQGRVLLEGLEDDTKKTSDVMRDLGATFSFAFEKAITGGEKFSKVLKGLAQDILNLVLRKTVTEPIAKSITGMFGGTGGGFDWSSLLSMGSSFFGGGGGMVNSGIGGGFAIGTDYVPRDMIAKIHQGERIIPAAQNESSYGEGGQGGLVVNINAPGADAAALRRVELAVQELNRSFDMRTRGVVRRGWNEQGLRSPFG